MYKDYIFIILAALFINYLIYGSIAVIITYLIPSITFWQAFWSIIIIHFLFELIR